jgi:hypothetical protein
MPRTAIVQIKVELLATTEHRGGAVLVGREGRKEDKTYAVVETDLGGGCKS